MGNAFVAGLKNEAPRGRDITNEDRNSEVNQRGTQRDAEGSEFSYSINRIYRKWLKTHSHNDEANYKKNYRRLLKGVIHNAKEVLVYYKELFNLKSNSIKQLRKN